ncbi:hypothetical protein REH65_19370 [Saccharopolyspora sp. ID03-671]|uniref:hypothetical protein n=1 Tax=Saccharopolyspora sp. ID03-671 TaxID=3073066 RepID=UPI00324F7119
MLATSYLQANEVEQAVTVAREVVDTAAGLKSYRVNSYLDEFRHRLRQHSDSPVVAEFESYASTQR